MDELPDKWADAGRFVLLLNMDQFAKPGILRLIQSDYMPANGRGKAAPPLLRQALACSSRRHIQVPERFCKPLYACRHHFFCGDDYAAPNPRPIPSLPAGEGLSAAELRRESGPTFRKAVSKSLSVPTTQPPALRTRWRRIDGDGRPRGHGRFGRGTGVR